ncbi:MAG TPA: AAA family ATPase, partial [Streptosporangiaceae bacterium]|nr:AAA family ATPase [Streptosporangiaceae bacterium]
APILAFNSSRFLGLRKPGEGWLKGGPPVTGPVQQTGPREMVVAPGSVILIDEASMLPLDHMLAIMRKATTLGCKVIVAGDQEQLAAVEGGGAMKLLSQRLGYVKLTEPVRFDSQWERDASLRLRQGDDTVLEEYDAEGRFRGGSPDKVMDMAARDYVANAMNGIHTRLVAADWQRCRELSRRVRDDLKHLGRVSDGPAVTLAEGAQASAGDLIVCRKNDHASGLANGDVLQVESVDGGRAVLRKVVGRDSETGGAVLAEKTIGYDQFAEMNLAYATTGHAAQGDTVTAGIALVTGNEARNWLYVAMSRGAATNHAYVVTRPDTANARPGAVPAPELARHKRVELERQGHFRPKARPSESERHHIAVLADILRRDSTEDSASQIQRRNLANADHLAVLHQIWQTETLEARKTGYKALLAELLPKQHRDAGEAHQAEWLFRTFRQAELCGQDPRRLTARAVTAGELNSARDVASVLSYRIQGYLAGMAPQARRWAEQVPKTNDPQLAHFLTEAAAAMDGRKDRLGEFAADTRPSWATDVLGEVPDEPAGRQEWQRKAASICAYREIYNFAREDEAIGPEPSSASPEKHAAWLEAFMAMNAAGSEDLSGLSAARLRARRGMYERETAWAPRYARNELREARIALHDAEQGRVRAQAEAQVARERGNEDAAALHERMGRSYEALAGRYRDAQPELVASVEDYDNWLTVTELSRRMAVAADTELRRRYPDQKIEPLRSAEPQPVTEAEHTELVTLPEDLSQPYERPRWLQELAAASRAYRESRAEREAQTVPAEDGELEPEGFAWRPSIAHEREAILQPPPPEIGPAELVAAAQAQASGPEAGD